jgi:hypothetical protein
MPALFAYLVALVLLLGGGYCGLSWLAAPQPVPVMANAKPRPSRPSHYDASSHVSSLASSPEARSAPTRDNDHVASAPKEQPQPQSKASPVTSKPFTKDEVADRAQDQRSWTANAQASPAETTASTPPAAPVAKSIKRPRLRQARSQSERHVETRQLALMTLRTVEFPDGWRATQLIPYREHEGAAVFELDD